VVKQERRRKKKKEIETINREGKERK